MPHELSDTQYTDYVRLQDLSGKYGGAEGLRKKIDKLEEDGAGYRQSIKDLEAKVIPEGAKVLATKDAEEYEAFKALGKTPAQIAAATLLEGDDKAELDAFKALEMKAADVAAIITERDELKGKDAQRTRVDSITAAVEALGWPKEVAATIADMKSLDEAVFEVKTEKVKDKDTKVPYVTVKGGQAAKLAEFAAQTDSLKGIRTKDDSGTNNDGGSWVDHQSSGGAQGGYDPVKAGQEMAKKQIANAGSTSAALT